MLNSILVQFIFTCLTIGLRLSWFCLVRPHLIQSSEPNFYSNSLLWPTCWYLWFWNMSCLS